MSFMKETLLRTRHIWDECVETPFVQELKTGSLPMEKFRNYMIQDSIYLKHYARIYGKAIFHASTLKEIQLFYSALSFVTDTESAVRLAYLKKFDMTDADIEFIHPLTENQNYIDFMVDIAEKGNLQEILMAIPPCMMSYCYIGRKIAANPVARESTYWDFIQDYSSEYFDEICSEWSGYADSICNDLPAEEQRELTAIFEKASLLELGFWKMAYGE
jgi:Putative transcription activator